MKTSTRLIHTLGSPDKSTGALIPPVHLSTVFAMEQPTSDDGFQYGRVGNPTRQILEHTLAQLEEGRFALVFSSGVAAITAVIMTLRQGDTVVCHEEVYEGTIRILKKVMANLGIKTIFVDMRDLGRVKNVLKVKPKLIFLESPTNPLLTILDISQISQQAHQVGAFVVVDNTLATPLLQKPLKLGADIVVESLTKAMGGHSDVIGGVVATNKRNVFTRLRFLQHTLGSLLPPLECFLILRGLKTLSVRLERQQANALALAQFLQRRPQIKTVNFPALTTGSQQDLFRQQMSGPGLLISFSLNEKLVKPDIFLQKLKLITIGHSFGGVETLIQQPTTMMDLSFTRAQRERLTISDNFFRLSVGLEEVSDLICDLRQAIESKS